MYVYPIVGNKAQAEGQSEQAHVPGPAQTELRRVTGTIHESLHRHEGFAQLLKGRLTASGYTTLLSRLYGFHYPLERALRAAPEGILGGIPSASREKVHLLRADLKSLGVSEAEIAALPLCRSVPSLHMKEHVFGCLYVVEGAGLGGQVLARKLDRLLGVGHIAGREFFQGRPEPDPLPWPVFCRLLEECAADGEIDEIAGTARRTFASLALWLNAVDDYG